MVRFDTGRGKGCHIRRLYGAEAGWAQFPSPGSCEGQKGFQTDGMGVLIEVIDRGVFRSEKGIKIV